MEKLKIAKFCIDEEVERLLYEELVNKSTTTIIKEDMTHSHTRIPKSYIVLKYVTTEEDEESPEN